MEAAIALPLLFLVLGLLLQPAILLYDRCVMEAAAAETCRVLETQTADEAVVRAYALRRLSAVPQAPAFHEGGDAGWQVELAGSELADEVSVGLSHSVRPLPLFGVTAGLYAHVQADGSILQEVHVSSSLQPAWAAQAEGGPDDWMGRWE